MAQEAFVEIDANGLPRSIFNIRQTAAGDLTVKLKASVSQAPVDALSFAGSPKIIEHRYQVHRSPKSEYNINTIKRTMIVDTKITTLGRMFTRSIKQTNSFTPLYFEQCSNLAKPQYDNSGITKERVSLGAYDPTKTILLYQVFIGSREREFVVPEQADAHVRQIIFNNFRVGFIWCFLTLPSADIGEIVHYGTENSESFSEAPKEPQRSARGFFDGFDEDNCVADFQWRREGIRMRIIHNTARTGINPKIISHMMLHSKFVQDGNG